ncbi:hypothetical protein P692DRAFT_20381323, partial [Suillus brevipes Sb2]
MHMGEIRFRLNKVESFAPSKMINSGMIIVSASNTNNNGRNYQSFTTSTIYFHSCVMHAMAINMSL